MTKKILVNPDNLTPEEAEAGKILTVFCYKKILNSYMFKHEIC